MNGYAIRKIYNLKGKILCSEETPDTTQHDSQSYRGAWALSLKEKRAH